MLVLGRMKDQSVMIRDEIEVVLVDVAEGRATVKITCPPEIPVRKSEAQEPEPVKDGEVVLDRGQYEAFFIGDEIEVCFLDYRVKPFGTICRFGYTAQRSIPIHRREIYEKIQKAKESAEPKA